MSSAEGGNAAQRREAMGGLAKGLAIIELFGIERPRLTVAEAANGAGMTRAAARRCLLTLEALDYVAHDGKHFSPLARLRRLGGPAAYAHTLPERAQPLLERLCEELNEPISLAVFDARESLFVARAEATRMVSTGVRLGGRLPAYCSATGRVLLGGLTSIEIDEYLAAAALVPRTPTTETDPARLRVLIAEAAANGVAFSDEELELGMRAMAVPVRNASGDVIAACSLSTASARVSLDEMRQSYLPKLWGLAALLSK